MTPIQRAGTGLLLAAMLTGCASHRPPPVVGQPVPPAPGYGYDRGHGRGDDRGYGRGYERGYDGGYGEERERAEFGRVQDIDRVRADSRTSGAGAVIGAVIGAVVGRQLGSGSGRDAGTAVGAVGGAILGNEVEKSNRGARDAYRIEVRLQRGDVRAFVVESPGDLRVGDRVRVIGNQIQRW